MKNKILYVLFVYIGTSLIAAGFMYSLFLKGLRLQYEGVEDFLFTWFMFIGGQFYGMIYYKAGIIYWLVHFAVIAGVFCPVLHQSRINKVISFACWCFWLFLGFLWMVMGV